MGSLSRLNLLLNSSKARFCSYNIYFRNYFCCIVYNSIPIKYKKLEETFGWFMNRSLVRFELETSPLHTIVYGGTGTGKTYFVRQYLRLYLDGNECSETH